MVNQEKLTEHKLTQKMLFCSIQHCFLKRDLNSVQKETGNQKANLISNHGNLPSIRFSQHQINWVSTQENLTLLHANIKGTDQPAHSGSLISTFVIHSLESMID